MHFLVLAPDRPATGGLRQELRAEHVAYWTGVGDGVVLVVGAMMSDDSVDAVPVGSSFLLAAESEQVVRDLLARDPFTGGGVFACAPQVQRVRPAIGSLWQHQA
jgi:uncharacterized protein YciI